MKFIYSKKYFLCSSVSIIFLLCTFFHFVYQFSHECVVIAMLAPMNESVFEHTKMIPVPLVGWWLTMFFIHKEKIKISCWLTSTLLSLLVSIGLMISLYYLYTGMFGIESLIIDIFVLFVSLLAGQWLGFHYYHHRGKSFGRMAIVCIIMVFFILAYFTFFPLNIPFFSDPALLR